MDEDARRRSNGGHDADQALISHGGQPNRNPARRVQCYNCEKLGHFSRDCTESPRQHSQPTAPAHRGGNRPKHNRKSVSHRKPQYKARVVVVEDEEDTPENFCFCTGIERGVKAEEWVVDSGATTHMTWDKGVIVTFAALHDMPSLRLGDGRTVKAEGKGSVRLRVKDNNNAECVIRLSSVLLVPDLSCNLFSVRDITGKGNKMLFDDVSCSIISKDNSVIANGHKRGNLYVLDGAADRRPDEAMVAAQPTSDLWHQRLAHVNDVVLQKVMSCDVAGVDLQKVEPQSFCEGCVQGKATDTRRSLWEEFVRLGSWKKCTQMYVARCRQPLVLARNIW